MIVKCKQWTDCLIFKWLYVIIVGVMHCEWFVSCTKSALLAFKWNGKLTDKTTRKLKTLRLRVGAPSCKRAALTAPCNTMFSWRLLKEHDTQPLVMLAVVQKVSAHTAFVNRAREPPVCMILFNFEQNYRATWTIPTPIPRRWRDWIESAVLMQQTSQCFTRKLIWFSWIIKCTKRSP